MAELNGSIDTGQMKVNTNTENIVLSCDQKYNIANGFHSGESIINCKSLAEQTVATATNDNIAMGSSGYVNGRLVTGSLPVREYIMNVSSMEANNDGSIMVKFPRGIYSSTHPDYNYPTIKATQSSIATIGNISANKIAKGKTYLEIAGTYTSDATVVASDIKKGKTIYANGVLVTGTLISQSPTNGTIQTNGPTSITISWYNPPIGPYAGVQIRMSTSGYPGKTGGTVVYTGTGSNTTKNGKSSIAITGLTGGTLYYFSIYGQCGTLDTSENILNLSSRTAVAKGSQTFLSSGIFTVPEYVYEIEYCVVGSGGGTYISAGSDRRVSSNGGGGGYVKNGKMSVTPGQQLPVVVGVSTYPANFGGEPSEQFQFGVISKFTHPEKPTPDEGGWTYKTRTIVNHKYGGSSMLGNIEAKGGMGLPRMNKRGADGGSGSGGIAGDGENARWEAGIAGSNGSDGGKAVGLNSNGYNDNQYGEWQLAFGGKGQGTTTRAFGDPNGTLYSTAGDAGIEIYRKCKDADPNTGNGAIGGGWGQTVPSQGLGGSGIVLVRWGY